MRGTQCSGPRKTECSRLFNSGRKMVRSGYGKPPVSLQQKAESQTAGMPRRGKVTCIESRRCTGRTETFLTPVPKDYQKVPDELSLLVVQGAIQIGHDAILDRRLGRNEPASKKWHRFFLTCCSAKSVIKIRVGANWWYSLTVARTRRNCPPECDSLIIEMRFDKHWLCR